MADSILLRRSVGLEIDTRRDLNMAAIPGS
jgi:hypothetical protein